MSAWLERSDGLSVEKIENVNFSHLVQMHKILVATTMDKSYKCIHQMQHPWFSRPGHTITATLICLSKYQHWNGKVHIGLFVEDVSDVEIT